MGLASTEAEAAAAAAVRGVAGRPPPAEEKVEGEDQVPPPGSHRCCVCRGGEVQASGRVSKKALWHKVQALGGRCRGQEVQGVQGARGWQALAHGVHGGRFRPQGIECAKGAGKDEVQVSGCGVQGRSRVEEVQSLGQVV